MRPVRILLPLLMLGACASPPAPVPVAPPSTPPPPPSAPAEERVTHQVRVTASALNVRREPSADAEVVTQVRKGTELGVLHSEQRWTKVRLADGAEGWVASRFVAEKNASTRRTTKKGGCPPDSDFAFLETPRPSFSDSGAHGLVVVEANVNAKGVVTAAKVISNGTGDDALAFLAEREIRSAKFSPPIRNCAARAFIFTYRRAF